MNEEAKNQGDWLTAGGDISRCGFNKGRIQTSLTLRWIFEKCNCICCGITSSHGIAIFGDCYGKGDKYWLVAVEVITGKELWRYEMPGMVFGTPTISDYRVFVGNGKAMTCLDLKSGRRIWYSETNSTSYIPHQCCNPSSTCSLHIAGYIFITDEALVVYRADDGKILFNEMILQDTWDHIGPCADERFVYFPYSAKEILRMNRSTGKFEKPIHIDGKVCSGPIISEKMLLYGTNHNTLQAISLETFSNCWTYHFPDDENFVNSRPAVAAGRAFLGGPDRSFYCLNLRDGKLIWKVPDVGYTASSPIICADKVFQFSSKYCMLLSVENGKIF